MALCFSELFVALLLILKPKSALKKSYFDADPTSFSRNKIKQNGFFFSSNEFLPFILSVYALCFNPKSLSFFSLTVA